MFPDNFSYHFEKRGQLIEDVIMGGGESSKVSIRLTSNKASQKSSGSQAHLVFWLIWLFDERTDFIGFF